MDSNFIKPLIAFIKSLFSKLSTLSENNSYKIIKIIVIGILIIWLFYFMRDTWVMSKDIEKDEIAKRPKEQNKITTHISIVDRESNKQLDSVQVKIPNLDSIIWICEKNKSITIRGKKDTCFSITVSKKGYQPDRDLKIKFSKNENTFLMKKI